MDNPQLQLEPRCVVGTQYSARTSTQEDSAADIADAYALNAEVVFQADQIIVVCRVDGTSNVDVG
jgi:hypothetical protein